MSHFFATSPWLLDRTVTLETQWIQRWGCLSAWLFTEARFRSLLPGSVGKARRVIVHRNLRPPSVSIGTHTLGCFLNPEWEVLLHESPQRYLKSSLLHSLVFSLFSRSLPALHKTGGHRATSGREIQLRGSLIGSWGFGVGKGTSAT